MRWLGVAMVVMASPAYGATSICRPTYEGFLEFECETRAPQVNAAPFCDVMNRQGGPVRWSRNDTEATKNRADLINAAGKRLCGWTK
jgi:hypothetical protein